MTWRENVALIWPAATPRFARGLADSSPPFAPHGARARAEKHGARAAAGNGAGKGAGRATSGANGLPASPSPLAVARLTRAPRRWRRCANPWKYAAGRTRPSWKGKEGGASQCTPVSSILPSPPRRARRLPTGATAPLRGPEGCRAQVAMSNGGSLGRTAQPAQVASTLCYLLLMRARYPPADCFRPSYTLRSPPSPPGPHATVQQLQLPLPRCARSIASLSSRSIWSAMDVRSASSAESDATDAVTTRA